MATESLRRHDQKRYDKLRDVPQDIQATVKKIVSRGTGKDAKPPKEAKGPNKSVMEAISNNMANNINDAKAIFEILPDTELAMQVLVSSILSPKDMISTEISYTSTIKGDGDEAALAVIKIIQEYFENTFGMRKRLTKMLNDMLFKTGSYPIMVVPENAMDAIINSDITVGKESVSPFFDKDMQLYTTGLLGDPGTGTADEEAVSLEGMFVDTTVGRTNKPYKQFNKWVSVTDNINALKVPSLVEKMTNRRVNDHLAKAGVTGYKVSTEARRRKTKRDEEGADSPVLNYAYRPRKYESQAAVQIQTNETLQRPSEGHPLVMKIPSESVIPVHIPSDPASHVGYFILLDKNGNPITKSKDSQYFRDLRHRMDKDRAGVSELIARVKEGMYGDDIKIEDKTEGEMVRAYTDLVEQDLVQRLKAGIYGDSAELSCPEEIGRIMMARALAKKHTQILYVPVELMTYMAFDYNPDGTGRSLLDGSKIISSLRAMMLFANTMASVKNSVGRTRLNIELDEDDPDPSSTVETIMHDFTRNSQSSYPLGTIDPSDITGFLQRAAVDVNVTGNPAYPETRTSIEDGTRSIARVDTDLEEELRNRHFMSMGIPPEIIDGTQEVEFATNIVSSNLLLAKRVILYQDVFCFFLTEMIKKFTFNSSVLLEEIKKTIEENKAFKKKTKPDADGDGEEDTVDQFIQTVIDSIKITLPTPDTAKIENQSQAYQQFNELLEIALEAYISADMFEGMLDSGLEDGIDGVIAALRTYFQRQWLRKNNVLPELDGIVAEDDDFSIDINKLHKEHADKVLKPMQELLRTMRKTGREGDRKLEEDIEKEEAAREEAENRIEELEAEVSSLREQLSQAQGAGSDDALGDDETGSDDLGGDDDLGGSEETPADDTGGDDETPPDDGGDDTPPDDELPEI